ncbi:MULTISPECIES: hypothetical protein [Oscillatoriales]|uniref:hypothetical protein n=1 Tax=Oscillatoriophycideae TaxID=1301283 RepID=UPI001683B19B|nr:MULTISPECIES: hypothetical protein [Oscillatoriales]
MSHIISGNIDRVKISLSYLRISAYICGKNLLLYPSRKFSASLLHYRHNQTRILSRLLVGKYGKNGRDLETSCAGAILSCGALCFTDLVCCANLFYLALL